MIDHVQAAGGSLSGGIANVPGILMKAAEHQRRCLPARR
jgi:hypothetical protein